MKYVKQIMKYYSIEAEFFSVPVLNGYPGDGIANIMELYPISVFRC